MNVILFQRQFQAPILARTKVHTIRPERRDGRPRVKLGEIISLRVWSARPYASPQLEFAQAEVTEIWDIRLTLTTATRLNFPKGSLRRRLNPETLARHDGFASWLEMRDWFLSAHGLPFRGVLIGWKLLPSEPISNILPEAEIAPPPEKPGSSLQPVAVQPLLG